MKNLKLLQFLSIFLVAGLLLFTTACSHKPKDEDIQANITKQLKESPDYKSINVSVKDGVVTLSGRCLGQGCDSLIENQVKGVDGVESIKNNIQKDVATDLTLRTSVQSIISKYEGVQADVAAGVVVLRGSIDKKQLQPMMNELEALKPKKLDNQLALK